MSDERGVWHEDTTLGPRLKALWLQESPRLSAQQIGIKLGLTKNQVVGKALRMNLPSRESPIIRQRDGAKSQPRILRVKGPTLPPLGAPVAPGALACDDTSTVAPEAAQRRPQANAGNARDCCWPIGEPGMASFRFCGEPVEQRGRPYCDEHHALAWVSRASIQRQAATLPEVEAYAAEHRVVPPMKSGLVGLVVAVNNHRRQRNLLPFMLTKREYA